MLFCLFLAGRIGLGHDDLTRQIYTLSSLIKQYPDSTELYMQRAELFRLCRNFGQAFDDLAVARDLNPGMAEIDLARGRVLLDLDSLWEARYFFNTFLEKKQGQAAAALALKALVEGKLGLYVAAEADYGRAVALQPTGFPEYYLERARMLIALGSPYFAEAIAVLEEGLKQMGPVITLQIQLIDYELDQRNFEGALRRLQVILESATRKEKWLKKRGDILMQAGRLREAEKSYQDALTALQKLPPYRRTSQSVRDLEFQIKILLAQIRD